MALCLCETRYGKFRAVKTYKWKELEQGNPWDGVIAKWETWASSNEDKFQAEPWLYDDSRNAPVRCKGYASMPGPPPPQIQCLLHSMGKVVNTNYGIEPEPKKTEPKNAQTPEDEFGPETGPYYQGQDPPGDYWDGVPSSWAPEQVGRNCPSTCLQPNGGDVLGKEDDRDSGSPVIWKRDTQVKDHYEEVEVKFWLSYKQMQRYGFDQSCCNGNGLMGTNYERGWEDNGGEKVYEPDWSGEPALKIEVPFGLFYQEYHQLIKMRKRHACL
jgi:hypothetical protein